MDLQTHSVPETVHEMLTKPSAVEHRSRSGVHLRTHRTWCHRRLARGLRLLDSGVELLLPTGRTLADQKRACHVGVVAVDTGSEVDGDQVATLDGTICGLVVWD